jgi:maltose O-acetyltransferase
MFGKRPAEAKRRRRLDWISHFVRSEWDVFHPRLYLAKLLVAFFPVHVGSRLRSYALSMAGFDIGARTVFWGMPRIVGSKNLAMNLHVGQDCWINIGCYFDLGDLIMIGDRVGIGQEVMLLTTTHQIGDHHRRVGPKQTAPIHIGNGVWLGARCTILPGVTVNDGAIVGAGALVLTDVPPDTLVAGIPAKHIHSLGIGS